MTTYSIRRQALVPLAGLLGVIVAFGAPALRATEQEEKVLYLTAIEKDGKAVTDLTTQDVQIREDNQDREVVSVKKSTQPLSIVVLADTTAQTAARDIIRDVRVSIASFMKRIAAANPQSQLQLMEFGQAALPITKMTSDVAELEKGVARLFPKPNAASVLLEAIIESSKELSKTKTARRAIVSLNLEPGDEQSRQDIKQLYAELSKSRAGLWAVSLQEGGNRNQARGVVLETLADQTGGRREFIQAQSALELIMTTFADNLLSQYEVTYKRPGGGKAQRVLVGVARSDLKLLASRIPPQ